MMKSEGRSSDSYTPLPTLILTLPLETVSQ
jgi:hypothetical protein